MSKVSRYWLCTMLPTKVSSQMLSQSSPFCEMPIPICALISPWVASRAWLNWKLMKSYFPSSTIGVTSRVVPSKLMSGYICISFGLHPAKVVLEMYHTTQSSPFASQPSSSQGLKKPSHSTTSPCCAKRGKVSNTTRNVSKRCFINSVFGHKSIKISEVMHFLSYFCPSEVYKSAFR